MRVEAIAAHARSLESEPDDAALRSRAYAEICASREIEIREQELRAFVVRHSVVRIHCFVAFAMLLIGLGMFGGRSIHLDGGVFTALIAFATLVIGASTRSILRGVAYR